MRSHRRAVDKARILFRERHGSKVNGIARRAPGVLSRLAPRVSMRRRTASIPGEPEGLSRAYQRRAKSNGAQTFQHPLI